MKKKLPIIMLLVAVLTYAVSLFPFDTFDEQIAVNDSKPTAQELEEFREYVVKDTYFYYNRLNTQEKEAYEVMYTSFMSFDESFTMDIPLSRLSNILSAVLYDNPHIFWVGFDYEYVENENTIDFYPAYILSENEADTLSLQLENKIDEIVSGIDYLLSDYEKELYIHDYICENTTYDKSTYKTNGHTAYSSLLNGKSICEGYSRAVQMLLNEVDIDNYLVIGNGISEDGEEPHMWNIVTLYGENYHLDATWDDPVGETEYNHYYFNVTDEYITRDHTDIAPDGNRCISMNHNYFVVENIYVKNFNSFNEHVERSVDVLRQGENTVEFLFESTEDYKKAVKMIKNDNGFFNYVSACVRKSGRKLDMYQVEYIYYDELNHLSVVFIEK